jgi:drug/metabolite transporter (DMT)-like permease
VAAGSLWGLGFPLGKIALAEMGFAHLVLARFTLACLALLPLAVSGRELPRLRDVPLFLLTGFLTVPVTFLLQFAGLAHTNAATASLIIGAVPPFLAIGAAWTLRERMGRLGWVAVCASTLGVGLIVGWPSADRHWLGDGLVALSVLAIVGAVLLSKQLLQRYSALTATTYILIAGTLSLLPIAVVWQGVPSLTLSLPTWGSLLALAIGATAATNTLWNWGLKHTTASHASIYVNLEPVVGALLGVLLLREQLGPAAAVGGVLVLASAVAVSLQGAGQ